MKSIIAFFLCLQVASAADYTVPATHQGNWLAGTYVGVEGGMEQYQPGGASARTIYSDANANGITDALESIDATGATDVTAEIQAVIDAATPGTVVRLPAGTFRTDGALGVYQNHSEITIRGAGPTATIIATRSNVGILVGQGGYFTGTSQTVTGTKTKGTSTLSVSDSTGFTAEYLVCLFVENETDNTRIQAGAAPALSWDGEPEVRKHVCHITARTGDGAGGAQDTITIDPPLLYDCTAYATRLALQTGVPSYKVHHVGIEDLKIYGGPPLSGWSADAGASFYNTANCWIHNVDALNLDNYPIKADGCYRLQIQKCTAGERREVSSSNGAGVLSNTCTSALIVDNIFKDINPLMEENFGSYNNVWAYNLGCELVAITMDVNHGAHNTMCLYEGNVAAAYHADGFFGTVSNYTFFRNWWHGSSDEGTTALGYTVSQNRGTRAFLNVGNIFGWDGLQSAANSYGNPNMGNSAGTGSATPSAGDFWADWKLNGTITTRVSDNEIVVAMNSVGQLVIEAPDYAFPTANGPFVWWGTDRRYRTRVHAISGLNVTFKDSAFSGGSVYPAEGTAVQIWANQTHFQDYDLDVALTNLMTNNYHANAAGTGAVQDSTADALPASLIYSSRPAWFTAGLTWPPINPNSPNFDIETTIPAALRYFAATPPDPEPSGPTITTGSLSIGGTLSIGN